MNLSLLYRWVGLGDNLRGPSDATRTLRDSHHREAAALAELTSGDFQEAQVRLEVSLPVGVRRELARIRNAQLTLRQRQDFLRESERLAVSQLSDAIGKSGSHFSQLQDAANEWQAAEQEVDARLLEYQKGLSPVNVVLQSQQRRAEAQISYYRALVEYNKSINYVDFLRGTLLANSNITLHEGPWNSKAYCDALERARERAAGHHLQYGVTRPGVVRRGPVADPNSIGLFDKSLNEVTPVDDVPLEALGSPSEMLSPEPIAPPMMPAPESGEGATGTPDGVLPAPGVLPTPGSGDTEGGTSILAPNRPDGSIAPISYQTETATPIGSGVQNAERINADTGAPMPVRRKPVPRADTPVRAHSSP